MKFCFQLFLGHLARHSCTLGGRSLFIFQMSPTFPFSAIQKGGIIMSRARCHRLALSLQNRIATNRKNLRTRYCYQTCITTRLIRRLFQTTTTRLDKDIQLFDSMNNEIQAIPETPGKALAWYTCGPTTCELLAPNYFTFAFFQNDSRFFFV